MRGKAGSSGGGFVDLGGGEAGALSPLVAVGGSPVLLDAELLLLLLHRYLSFSLSLYHDDAGLDREGVAWMKRGEVVARDGDDRDMVAVIGQRQSAREEDPHEQTAGGRQGGGRGWEREGCGGSHRAGAWVNN